jgi:hypothetical protein
VRHLVLAGAICGRLPGLVPHGSREMGRVCSMYEITHAADGGVVAIPGFSSRKAAGDWAVMVLAPGTRIDIAER